MSSRQSKVIRLLVLGILTASLCVVFGASIASAETEMKRSAGTMKRSSGERKGNDLNSQTKGRDSRISSRRASSRSGPRLPSEDKYDYDDKEKDSYWDSSSSSSASDEDDEEFESDSAPTLGRACIYGPGDQVVYRPKGSWCRGDEPLPDEPRHDAPTDTSSGSSNAYRQVPASPAASAYGYPEVRRKKKVKRKTSAGCLYGKDGEILYAPETSDCVNGIGAPPRP